MTSLSAIYQGNIPILQYSQRHVDQLSRIHLRYVLTKEMTPWIDRLITYISNPLQNEDPKPYSKHYSAGGKELVDHNLEQNITKRAKTISTRQNDTETGQMPSKQSKMEASTINPMESAVTNNTHANDTQLDPPSRTSGAALTYNLRSRRHHQHTIKHTKGKRRHKEANK